ncbi:30S ribosomal protein S4 [Candidatus Peregrinibacteria bacterium]|nr:30S ribosomal protein S4 [Candidatus Peregrinibacteria bacterium]
MRYLKPKAKLCRRLGVNLFGTEKYTKILRRRQAKPGVHGAKFSRKKSEFGHQLEEKQKAKFVFGIHEKQFQKYFQKAVSQPGDTAENLLRLLERRLDNVVYVSQFAVTRVQARQMVAHGHFRLNGRRIDIPSVLVRPGDKITIAPKLKDSPLFAGLEKLKNYAPKWLKVDLKSITAEVAALPEKDDLEKTIDSQLIVEFYSR